MTATGCLKYQWSTSGLLVAYKRSKCLKAISGMDGYGLDLVIKWRNGPVRWVLGGFGGSGGSVWVMGEWSVGQWIVGVISF